MKKTILAVVIMVMALALFIWIRDRNPLKSYGVQMEWRFGGATSSVPSLFVWWEKDAQRIDAPNIFGGVADPSLSFADVDGDGIPDIIFTGARNGRRVVAFHPSINGREPTFVILENSILGD